ncbi:GNAT family N-acetyltransferase [Candidatus Dependentiae bacterium]|nr:GNAT family N-acetyltransferase [Candidatus Dependentiae bacterium]
MNININDLNFRNSVKHTDISTITEILQSTEYFYDYEIEVAADLAKEYLKTGTKSGYNFLFAENNKGIVAGYVCYGPIACTVSSFDLYWIAVHKNFQKLGLGKILLVKTEELIKSAGGKQIYIETSNSLKYISTRSFYLKCGYIQEAVLKNFYGPGDDKVIYSKHNL